MKEKITSKINKVGKIGRIVSKIAQIAVSIGAVAMIVGIIICMIVPEGTISFKGTAHGVVSYRTDQKIVRIDTTDNDKGDFEFFGGTLHVDATESQDAEKSNINNIDINATAGNFTEKQLKVGMFAFGGLATCMMISLYFVFMYSGRLSKTLEKCTSPFEKDVLTAMKKLGYSFIPFGVFSIVVTGISAIALIMTILVVFMFIYVFSYGAELQQESDDTV